jgi:catechol 2,3-dioxygenase-like lactoylglutathione lyase family enzyme
MHLALTALLVRDYDEAIAFFVDMLGFELREDRPVPEQGKRWVVVAPRGAGSAGLLLARAVGEQQAGIGRQAAGRVFLFLHTDDVHRDVAIFRTRGVEFVREPATAGFGTAAVFRDLYGNLWDLVQPA